jgi:hypothetical protein
VTLTWNRALPWAAAAGAAFIAWKKIGVSTRNELKIRGSCAFGVLLGNPAAYRVTVLKSGNGPGISITGGPSIASQCTVVGVQGDGFSMSWPKSPDGAVADEGEEWGEDDDGDEDEDVTDETVPAPNVVPAVCEDGHVSYSARFIQVHDTSVYRAWTPTPVGSCPECGKARTILAGVYRAGEDGFVTRGELPADET